MGYISIAELWFPYDRRVANDRRWSQKIEHGSIFCDRLRLRSHDRRRSQKCVSIWSQTIAELSAIRDRLRSYGNQPLRLDFVTFIWKLRMLSTRCISGHKWIKLTSGCQSNDISVFENLEVFQIFNFLQFPCTSFKFFLIKCDSLAITFTYVNKPAAV